jgi:putative membrane protein
MFIDYVALLLLNTAAAYFILAGYVYKGIDDPDQRKWALGFGIAGFISLLFGAVMCFTWPLPGPYNSAYGEMSVLLGTILLASALALANGWNLMIIAVYGFFAGAAAIVTGAAIIAMKLTLEPVMSGIGFILSGAAGIFAAPTLAYFRGNKAFRLAAAVVLIATGLLWSATVYPEYFMHAKAFAKWMPLTMRGAVIR